MASHFLRCSAKALKQCTALHISMQVYEGATFGQRMSTWWVARLTCMLLSKSRLGNLTLGGQLHWNNASASARAVQNGIRCYFWSKFGWVVVPTCQLHQEEADAKRQVALPKVSVPSKVWAHILHEP